MNIGLSTSVIQRGKSGVAQYVLNLTRALLPFAGEHQFTLFVLDADAPLFAFAKGRMNLVRVAEKWRAPAGNIFWHQARLPVLARSHRLDVLHVPSYRRMLWRKPCARVTTIHDLAPFHVPGKYDWKRMLYGRVIAKRLSRRQDEIIAVSQNTADDIARFFGVSRDRLTVIYNGIDHTRFFPGRRTEAKAFVRLQSGLAQPFFLYLARLEHPGKNHVRLIEAFNRFKTGTRSDWQLVFGGSDWPGADIIHAAIKASPFAADIRCLGFVPEEHLPHWYRAADVLVYPSLFEGFGLPPIEAMACGCPVICSTRGALGEVIGTAAATINPEDVSIIKFQLERLAMNEALREQLRLAGLERARLFDWNRTAAATVAVYAKAVRQIGNPLPSAHRLRGVSAAPIGVSARLSNSGDDA